MIIANSALRASLAFYHLNPNPNLSPTIFLTKENRGGGGGGGAGAEDSLNFPIRIIQQKLTSHPV